MLASTYAAARYTDTFALVSARAGGFSATDNDLLALNLNAKDDAHLALNQKIVETGKRIRGDTGDVELHVVNACPDVDRLVQPTELAQLADVAISFWQWS